MTNEPNKESKPSVENVRYITCPDCGEQIMMVPVLGQMIEAIENHISTHNTNPGNVSRDLPTPHPRAPSIEDDLTEQVLTRAAEISDALSRNPTWINRQ